MYVEKNIREHQPKRNGVLDCHKFELIEVGKKVLISSPGTRFPRAVREASSAPCACGVSPGHVFPQESRTLRSNQLQLLL